MLLDVLSRLVSQTILALVFAALAVLSAIVALFTGKPRDGFEEDSLLGKTQKISMGARFGNLFVVIIVAAIAIFLVQFLATSSHSGWAWFVALLPILIPLVLALSFVAAAGYVGSKIKAA